LPAPSEFTLPRAPLPGAPPALAVRLVLGLRRFLVWLADRLTPAELALFDLSTGVANTSLLGAVARFGLADFLAAHGPSDARAIARGLGLHAESVHRALRALSNMGVFRMTPAGTFENNRISRTLCSGHASGGREWALYFSSHSNAESWLDLARTLQSGESAFTRLHGINVWQWFDQYPDEREIFAHCMMRLTLLDAPVIAKLYPFAEVQRLCDVGGGRGTLLSELLLCHPQLRAVLYDGPGVVASAQLLLEQRGVGERVELSTGSFFESVPGGCDAYLMKNILHDWDDETCKQLLGNVRRAAREGARLILCESLVELNSRDLLGTRADVQMMVACHNGRERSRAEFESLLAATGFAFRRVFPYPTLCIIEAVAVA
jgi:hypothetical protein